MGGNPSHWSWERKMSSFAERWAPRIRKSIEDVLAAESLVKTVEDFVATFDVEGVADHDISAFVRSLNKMRTAHEKHNSVNGSSKGDETLDRIKRVTQPQINEATRYMAEYERLLNRKESLELELTEINKNLELYKPIQRAFEIMKEAARAVKQNSEAL